MTRLFQLCRARTRSALPIDFAIASPLASFLFKLSSLGFRASPSSLDPAATTGVTIAAAAAPWRAILILDIDRSPDKAALSTKRRIIAFFALETLV